MYACELKAIVCMIFLLISFQSIDFVFQLFSVCFFRSSLCYLVHLHCCFMQYVFLAWTLHQFDSFNSFSLFIISICIGGKVVIYLTSICGQGHSCDLKIPIMFMFISDKVAILFKFSGRGVDCPKNVVKCDTFISALIHLYI